MLTDDNDDVPRQVQDPTNQEIYSAAMNEWLASNGSAPMGGDSGWRAHEVGLAAVVTAAKAAVLLEIKANLSGTIGPVKCDADETGTFLEGMVQMRAYIEAELDDRAADTRAPIPARDRSVTS